MAVSGHRRAAELCDDADEAQDALPSAVMSSFTTWTEYGVMLGMLAFRVTLSTRPSSVEYTVGAKVTFTTAEIKGHQ